MNRKAQLKFCTTCKYKKRDLAQGIICLLTNETATFNKKCPDYEPDMAELKKKKEELITATKANEGRAKALTVFYFLIAISILSSITSFVFFRKTEDDSFVKDIVRILIEGGLYFAIFKGKNWARMLLTALLVIGIGAIIYFIIVLIIPSQALILVLLPFLAIYVYIIYFIYGDKDFLLYFNKQQGKIER